ncbi:MAG: hypothetical protein AB1483_04500 [Candidatus Zixiibacteriota bacterium]
MKKTLVGVLLLPVVFLASYVVVLSGEEAWMDLKNCEMCKPIMDQDPALMRNMTWEHHNLSNGLVSVSTVAPAYLSSYNKAGEKMTKVMEKLERGEQVMLCNMCSEMSQIMKSGKVKYESVMTSRGSVCLTTTEDPKLLTRLQQWGERTNEELAMMARKVEMSEKPKPGQKAGLGY